MPSPFPILCLVWAVRLVSAQYNITVTDQSPLISYTPPLMGSGNSSSGSWNVTYSLSPWSGYQEEQTNVGQGISVHWTEVSRASASLSFSGNAIYAMGQIAGPGGPAQPPTEGGDGTVQLQIDSQTFSSSSVNGYLAAAENLGPGWHTALLYYTGSGTMVFQGFVVTLDIGGTVTNSTMSLSGSEGPQSINANFQLSVGDWSLSNLTTNGPLELLTAHPNAAVTFDIPSGTAAIILYGNASPVDGNYTVTLNTPSSAGPYMSSNSSSSSPSAAITTASVSSSNSAPIASASGIAQPPSRQAVTRPVGELSPWLGVNVIQYIRELDASAQHSLQLVFPGPQGYGYGLNSVVLIQATNTSINSTGTLGSNSTGSGGGTTSSSSSSSDTGAIVGGVVGGVAFLVIVALAVWFYLRRERRKSKQTDVTAFQVDADPNAGYEDQNESLHPTAYPTDASAAYSAAAGLPRQPDQLNEKSPLHLAQPVASSSSSGVSPSASSPLTSNPSMRQVSDRRTSPSRLYVSNTDSSRAPTPTAVGFSPEGSHTYVSSSEDKPPEAAAIIAQGREEDARRRAGGRAVGNPSHLVQEVDAGRVGAEVERLPPSYNANWLSEGRTGPDAAPRPGGSTR